MLLALLFAFSTGQPSELPVYRPEAPVSGLVRIWGSEEMAGVLKAWEAGFAKYQPGVQFFATLKGTQTAQAALYTDVADIALMGRQILPLELYPLFRRTHHFPFEVTVGTGSYSDRRHTFALAVFVNQRNPLAKLTLDQIDGIFAAQRNGYMDRTLKFNRSSDHQAKDNLRTWGQLGLTGEWADKPIHVYGYPGTVWAESDACMGAADFLKCTAFRGGEKWNENLVEFETGEKLAAAVAADPYGIGYTGLAYSLPDLKPLAVAPSASAAAVPPTRAAVASHAYPLTRSVYMYIRRAPGAPGDPKVEEFLRYVLSREGQEALQRSGVYLPLPAGIVRQQLNRLE